LRVEEGNGLFAWVVFYRERFLATTSFQVQTTRR